MITFSKLSRNCSTASLNILSFFLLKDAVLANNALELLVMCLQLRSRLMNVFYGLPNLNEFIIDVLTGTPSEQVCNICLEVICSPSE